MFGSVTTDAIAIAVGTVTIISLIIAMFARFVFAPAVRGIEQKIDDAVEPLKNDIRDIRYEVRINSGQSLKDYVMRNREEVIELRARFEEQERYLVKEIRHAAQESSRPTTER